MPQGLLRICFTCDIAQTNANILVFFYDLHKRHVCVDSILLRPYRVRPIIRQFNTNPMYQLGEPLPCLERDLNNMSTRERG